MDKGHEYPDKGHLYTAAYMRNSKAIGVLWGVFTICFAIINVVVFIHPQWIGDTQDSKGTGHFGLWKWCSAGRGGEEICQGELDSFDSLLGPTYQAAAVLVGLSVVLTLCCIVGFLLLFFVAARRVFFVSGWLQLLSACLLLAGVAVFPSGWDLPEVREVCGPTARQYDVGGCEIRWAFMLAMIGVVDGIVLAALAFVLATRSVTWYQEPEPLYQASIYKGQMNPSFVADGGMGGGSLAGSRKSLNLQPVMLMPQPEHDRYSEFSHHTARSKASANPAYRAHYASSVQNFQL